METKSTTLPSGRRVRLDRDADNDHGAFQAWSSSLSTEEYDSLESADRKAYVAFVLELTDLNSNVRAFVAGQVIVG